MTATLPDLEQVKTELARRKLGHFIRQSWEAIDPAEYVHGWHIDLIAEHLEAVTHGEIRRLLINIPPRCMKSIGTCVAWPAWTWAQPQIKSKKLQGPQVRWLFTSYAHGLSIRDSVRCRGLIQSKWYQDRWGHLFKLTGDQNTKIRFDNDKKGSRLSTSTDGAVTGEGGNIIVVDDPHNVLEANSDAELKSVTDNWDQGLSTRRNNAKTDAYVVIMQRLSERDLSGHIISKEYDRWTHLCLPMEYEPKHPYVYGKDPRKKTNDLLWPEHLGPPEVADLKKSLGSYGTAGQLQQRPAPAEGGMFKRHWFEIVGAVPIGSRPARAWDLAATKKEATNDPDNTATAKWWRDRAGVFYISNISTLTEAGLVVLTTILQQAQLDGKACPIFIPQDPGQAGKTQIEDYIRRLAGYIVISHVMSGEKTTRAKPWAIQAEAGNVKLVKIENPLHPEWDDWIEPFLQSAVIFPNGRHDDDIDACSDAFETLLLDIPVPIAAPVGVDLVSPYPI